MLGRQYKETIMEPNGLISSNINEKNLYMVADWAKDYAISKGIVMRPADLTKDTRVPLPFCITPSPIPEKLFNLACELQSSLNTVLFKVSQSREFLKDCLSSTVKVDAFTANIFKIFDLVEGESNEQLSLGLVRSDYLLDCDSVGNINGLKQVENNTIASSFGGLSPCVRDLHRYILNRVGNVALSSKLPVNESLIGLAKGIIGAWDAYRNPRSIVLFVVEEFASNICDQRAVEHTIVELRPEIEVLRSTFKDLRTSARLEGNLLFVDNKEVAVIYYRTGYVPNDYEEEDWDTRLLMEKSRAVKCPSAGLHLAGTKRVQLQLTLPGVLEKFIEHEKAEKLRQVFVNLHSLEMGEEGDKAVCLGIENPNRYVLKPEREGGGNNIYGADIRTVLESLKSSEKRNAYILMERINPPIIPNCIVQRDKIPVFQNIICELGIFGVILGDKKNIKLNYCAGHLLRSKESFCDETGVAAGFGALDSPCLI